MLPPGMLSGQLRTGESSEQVRARVLAARERQLARCGKVNAGMNNHEIQACCTLTSGDAEWLEQVLLKLGLSVRAWQRILKVARTIADLAGETSVGREHLTEAVSYRGIDRLLIHLHNSLD